jgi:hypothetical protein
MSQSDPAMHGAIMFFSVSCYRQFATLTPAQCQEAADFASEQAQRYPLWMRDGKTGEFPQVDVPHFGTRSSVYLMAIMSAYLVWSQKKAGVESMPDSPLLDAAVMGYRLYEGGK